MNPGHWKERILERLDQSKFFAVSLALHFVLVVALGMTVITQIELEPPDLVATDGLYQPEAERVAPPEARPTQPGLEPSLGKSAPATQSPASKEIERAIRSTAPSPLQFLPSPTLAPAELVDAPNGPPAPAPVSPGGLPGLSPDDLRRIGEFTDWGEGDSRGQPVTNRKFQFHAFLARYDGNWNSSVTVRDGRIAAGSLPNLLYLMSHWSKDRIQTNERNVEAVPLDSPRLLAERPPFVFLSGTRDFHLSDAEIENLRLYIRNGGAIWGDSSLPGERSPFDEAFQREMRRVVGEGAPGFAPLEANHPIFAAGYFPRIRQLPAGINFSSEPVNVLRWNGEIAVLHTRNAYADMWRIGLDHNGAIDLGRNARNEWIATDPDLWNHRESYVRNLEPDAVRRTYEFGINVVVHLLTRWESRTALNKSL